MSLASQQIGMMIDMLPENEQILAYELIKRLVLAWDPDFTKAIETEAHTEALQKEQPIEVTEKQKEFVKIMAAIKAAADEEMPPIEGIKLRGAD